MSLFGFHIDPDLRYHFPAMRLYRRPLIWATGPDGVPSLSWGDEEPLQWWKPGTLSWGTGGTPSTLSVEYQLGQGRSKSREHPDQLFAIPGDQFRLVSTLDGIETEWFCGLAGMENMTIQASPDAERYEWTLYGPELRLQAKRITGAWYPVAAVDDKLIAGTSDASDRVLANVYDTYYPAVLNPGGLPNCGPADKPWQLCADAWFTASDTDSKGNVFLWPERTVGSQGSALAALEAVHWTAYTALRSVIEWMDSFRIISYWDTRWSEIEAMLPTIPLPEINLQGMSILDAIGAILRPVGFGFALTPWSLPHGTTMPVHQLLVYSLHTPARTKRPVLADTVSGNVAITSEEGQRAVIQRLNLMRDNHNVADNITIIGDQYRHQTAFDFGGADTVLQPYWDTTSYDLASYVDVASGQFREGVMADTDYDTLAERINIKGTDHDYYTHLWRSWHLNEDGLGAIFGQSIPDAVLRGYGWVSAPTGAVLDTPYIRRPRPMGPLMVCDADSDSTADKVAPAQVWMAITNAAGAIYDASWVPFPCKVWDKNCGFTLEIEKLIEWYPWTSVEELADTIVSGTTAYDDVHFLSLLYATIAATGDLRLLLRFYGTMEADYTMYSSTKPDVSSDWPLGAQRVEDHRQRFVYRKVYDVGRWTSRAAIERDDSTDIAAYASRVAEANAAAMGHGSILLRHVTREYEPGMGIPSTSGRTVHFDLVTDGSKYPIVVGINWTFTEGANKTELVLDSPLAEVLG